MKRFFALLLAFALLVPVLWAQDYSSVSPLYERRAGVNPNTELADAYNAYRDGDYRNAVALLKKALTERERQSADVLYIYILALLRINDYQSAYSETAYFLRSYPNHFYTPLVKYHQGRALFYLGEYDKAVIVLGDFCHENPSHLMYPSALFWIGESFYAGYNFGEAKPFYERILAEFPDAAKAVDARYRLDAINSRNREAKLLYLLQQTGENYLLSKENYEKALRRYELENSMISAAAEEAAAAAASASSGDGDAGVEDIDDYDLLEALRRLKRSAAEAQGIIDTENIE